MISNYMASKANYQEIRWKDRGAGAFLPRVPIDHGQWGCPQLSS